MTIDQLQNEVLNLAHHIEDVKKAVNKIKPRDKEQYADIKLAMSGIDDIIEGIGRIKDMLPTKQASEIDRIAGEIEEQP